MTTAVTIAPTPILAFFNNQGQPCVGGSVLTQVGGVNTATYQDSAGTIALPNPIPLNNRGEISNAAGISCQLFLATGIAYTFTLNDANGNLLNQASYVTTPSSVSAAALLSSIGATLVGMILGAAGAVYRTIASWIGDFPVTPQGFGAVGGGIVDDSAAFTAMWATGLPWMIPYVSGGYLISTAQTINSNGVCYGQLIAKVGFSGRLVTICNPFYGTRRIITGLSVYSQDIRPNPYTAAASTGIYVGPNATFLGNTPCPNVALYSCSATRFSYGLDIGSFNIDVYSGQYYQNDHNCRVYSTDTTNNQINDVRLWNCAMDSAQSSIGQAYALRIGTTGNATYTASVGMGYGVKIYGCNFDGAPVYVDNVIGFDFRSYCEQGAGYTYHGGAIVLGSAGANTLQDVNISHSTFIQFDYAVVEKNTVLGLVVGPNNCSAVKYRELLAVGCEAQGFRYIRGTAIGSFNTNSDPVGTNFSSGIALSQITFNGIGIDSDFLTLGVQLAPAQNFSTNWYPKGMTLDGWQSLGSAAGRYRSGAAVQTGIAGTQAGQVVTFTTPAQAQLFNGGDSLTGAGAGAATRILSVDYVAGTCVVETTFAGATTLSHSPAYFVGYNLSGSGTPLGVVVANPGSRYVSVAGGAVTTTYVKETGVGTSAGWVAK